MKPKDTAELWVVMVSFHTGAILFESIDSVLSQAGLGRLVIVDNGNPQAAAQNRKTPAEVTICRHPPDAASEPKSRWGP